MPKTAQPYTGVTKAGPSNALSQVSLNSSNTSKNPSRPGTSKSFFQHSPALSQISFGTNEQDNVDEGNHVNRRLFGTPHPSDQHRSRIASTPFVPQAISPPPRQQQLDPISALQEIGLANTRKRRLEDLFGDIRDIDDDQQSEYLFAAIAKKAKSEEQIDLEMIERILEKRKQLMAQLNPLKNTKLDKLEALHKFKMQNLSYSLPRFPFTTLVRYDAERLYVRMHSTEFEDKQINEIKFTKKSFAGLLGDSRDEIWTRAQEIVNLNLILFSLLLNNYLFFF